MSVKTILTKNKEQIQEMKALYNSGLSLAEVGDIFGIPPNKIWYVFKVNGIETRKRTHSQKFINSMKARLILLDKDVLTKLYIDQQLSIRKVAEELNTKYEIVRKNLQYHEIPIRPPAIYTTSPLTAELLKPLFIDKNLPAAEIAERLGYSVLTIRKRLHNFGIKKRIVKSKIAESASIDNQPELLTAADIAKKYNTHIVTVREWCREGVLPNAYLKRIGKSKNWIIPAQDLENFMPSRKGTPTKTNPAFQTILKRANRAQTKIKELHGYGKKEILEMIALEKEGFSRAEIAARYRIEERLVTDILEKAAIKPPRVKKTRPGGRILKRFTKDLLIELYCNAEFSVPYILETLNTNYSSLYVNLRYYGIPLRDEHARAAAQEMEQSLGQMYLKDNLTPAEIAGSLGVKEAYVRRRLREFKISKP